MSSRTLHSSSVQVLVNASGKKSSTAGPPCHSEASGTCSFSCEGSVTSGARSPTFSPIVFSRVLRGLRESLAVDLQRRQRAADGLALGLLLARGAEVGGEHQHAGRRAHPHHPV